MKIYSVSEFVRAVSDYLEMGLGSQAVQGEVVDFRISKNRLIYFELKDDASRMLCFAIKGTVDIESLENGTEVKVLGVPKLFKGTGGFHLHVQEIEHVGEGVLQKKFEQLKKKLSAEGLFDEQYKKPIPAFPESIGIITSRDAAAYTDVITRLNERWGGLDITLAHVGVQGLGSVGQIVSAIEYMNAHHPVGVLILTRGGGGLEDLQSFNDEQVVRAVFASNIPIIVGVGHERDFTLAEFAADLRASTPTNAAELAVPHKREVLYKINHLAQSMTIALEGEISEKQQRAYEFVDRVGVWFERVRDHVSHTISLLNTLSPLATLERGYSITMKHGKVIKQSSNVKAGDVIITKLSKGEIESIIN